MKHEKLLIAAALAIAPFALGGCHSNNADAQSTVFTLSSVESRV